MNVADFIERFRLEMADNAAPYLWSDEEIVAYLNDAVNEACIRARLIEDSTTPAVCMLTLTPGQSSYELHKAVFDIRRVTFNGKALGMSSVEAEDENDLTWESRKGSEPLRVIVSGANRIRVVPEPTEPVSLKLTVYRTPINELSSDADSASPEIAAVYHPRLKDWVYRCAYLKHDAETFDETSANDFEARFDRSFGTRPDANVVRKRRDRALPVTRCNW
ncbi:DUF6682 family protein [Aquabacterium sp.]|uniref:phage adaptor protein n=1 Tax=Aquabacterium sp. TaxID=1872578 RepID=UPI0035B30806